jgi:beta-galactosidase
MFFQWRASRGGQERFHSAMLPHSGADSRTFREIVALGEELERLGDVAGSTSQAEVAILFDWNGWWGLEETHGLPRNDFSYPDTVMRHYAPLFDAHVPVDVVHPTSDLSRYRVLVVPNAYLIDDAGSAAVAAFVEGGGTVVMSFFSGVVDEANRVRPDGYPGAFRTLIGAKIDEYWPARGDERFTVEFADGRVATSTWWRDDIHLESATALATYRGGLLDGQAAVVENAYGAGRAVYIATLLDEAALASVLLDAVEAAGVQRRFADVPAHVECAVRRDETSEFVFLLNHSAQESATVAMTDGGLDLITGTDVAGAITLEPLGVAVIRRRR